MPVVMLPARQLLLIHGWGMNKAVWNQLEQYLKDDINVLSVDLPGYGKADNLPQPYSLNNLAKELSSYLDKAEQTIVLGWSLGGLVAIELAKLFPHKISQLILVASNPKFVQTADWKYAVAEQVFVNFANELKKDIKKTIKRFIAIQSMGSKTAKEDIKMIAGLIEQHGYANYDTLNKGLDILLSADQRNTLLSLTLPVLMIAGNRDQLVNIAALDFLCKHSEYISLETITGAGHAPFISHFEIFLSLIKNNIGFTS
jgi:pimeloyl-[acyl-carrier protein] methyl ester esterase